MSRRQRIITHITVVPKSDGRYKLSATYEVGPPSSVGRESYPNLDDALAAAEEIEERQPGFVEIIEPIVDS